MSSSVFQRLLKNTVGLALLPRKPKLSGRIHVRGTLGDVTIHRDAYGIPHIRAARDADVFFGLGFCHGQDRGGQLELALRAVRGTLAEVAGEDGIALDRLSRRIGFKRAARKQWPTLDALVREQHAAYARGVHAGMTDGMTRKPLELTLLGCEPTPWEPEDVQAMSVLLCFALASNWDAELLRLEVLEKDGVDALLAIDAPYPGDLPTTEKREAARPLTANAALRSDLAALSKLFPISGASNAWALHGSKTKSGRPILASDPHLPPDMPVHWYLAHLASSTFRASGASFVGIPGIAIGHNDFCAWGVTAAHADNTDFFLEEVGPDGLSVRGPDGFEPCHAIDEIIRVKGKPPVRERVLQTARGPIVSPALEGTQRALSLSATWLEPRPYKGLYLAHRTRGRSAFFDLFREASTSSINLVYADVEGHIGWRLGVDVPIRSGSFGTIPQPGWEARAWTGARVPFEEMPHVLDPDEGFVVNANNAPLAPDEGAPIFGWDFLDGYRQKVLTEALASRSDFTLDSVAELQRGTRSVPWEQLRAVILGTPTTEESAALAKALLEEWDGNMDEASIGATIWALTSAKLIERVIRAKAPNTAARAMGCGFHEELPVTTMITRRLSHLVKVLRDQPEGWLREGFPTAIGAALSHAVQTLRARFGHAPGNWAWGTVRPLRFHHAMGKSVPALDHYFSPRPVPFAGDASTVLQASTDFLDPLSGPLAVPNLRVVIDVGAWENSRFALIAGQSADPTSPHHFDHFEAWKRGGLPIAWTEDVAKSTAAHTLVLAPR